MARVAVLGSFFAVLLMISNCRLTHAQPPLPQCPAGGDGFCTQVITTFCLKTNCTMCCTKPNSCPPSTAYVQQVGCTPPPPTVAATTTAVVTNSSLPQCPAGGVGFCTQVITTFCFKTDCTTCCTKPNSCPPTSAYVHQQFCIAPSPTAVVTSPSLPQCPAGGVGFCTQVITTFCLKTNCTMCCTKPNSCPPSTAYVQQVGCTPPPPTVAATTTAVVTNSSLPQCPAGGGGGFCTQVITIFCLKTDCATCCTKPNSCPPTSAYVHQQFRTTPSPTVVATSPSLPPPTTAVPPATTNGCPFATTCGPCEYGLSPAKDARGCTLCQCYAKPIKVYRVTLSIRNLLQAQYTSLSAVKDMWARQVKAQIASHFSIPGDQLSGFVALVLNQTGVYSATISFNLLGSDASPNPITLAEKIVSQVSSSSLVLTYTPDAGSQQYYHVSSASTSEQTDDDSSSSTSSSTVAIAVAVPLAVVFVLVVGVALRHILVRKRARKPRSLATSYKGDSVQVRGLGSESNDYTPGPEETPFV